MNKNLLPVIFVWIFQSAGLCQHLTADSVYYRLDSVIVTASRYEQPLYRIPFSVDIISPAASKIPGESISGEGIFRFIPGIVVNNRYNLSEGDRISIRGIGSRAQFGVTGIKILLDGIPLTFPDGQSELNNLDPNTIGRIEIVRGPSSFLYGNSSGGVIAIRSKDIYPAKTTLNAAYRTGSFGFHKYSVTGSGRIGNNSLSVDFNEMNYGGFRENSSASTTAFNIISTQSFDGNLSLEGVFNYYFAPYLLNPSSLSKTDAELDPALARTYVKEQGAGKSIGQGQAGITLSYEPDKNQKIETTVYGISRSMINPIPGKYIKLDRVSGGIMTNYSTSFTAAGKNFDLLTGADYEFQNDLRHEYENNGVSNYGNLSKGEIINNVVPGNILVNQREKVNGLGIFFRLGFSLLKKLYLTAGLRYDNYLFGVDDMLKANGLNNSGSVVMDNLSRMAGLVYRISPGTQIYANYSTSFQTPTTTELGNTPSGRGGFNTSLKPELISSYEIGIRGEVYGKTFVYRISSYHLNINDILISYQLPGSQSDEVFYRNTGAAFNNGLGIRLNWLPGSSLNFTAAFTLMNFKFKNFTEYFLTNSVSVPVQIGGKKVPGVPAEVFSFGCLYTSGFGLNSDITFSRTGEYFVNDLNGPEPGSSSPQRDYVNDAYSVADFKMSYGCSAGFIKADIFAGISNLFNIKYNGSVVPNAAGDRYFEPAAPRNWYGGLSLNF